MSVHGRSGATAMGFRFGILSERYFANQYSLTEYVGPASNSAAAGERLVERGSWRREGPPYLAKISQFIPYLYFYPYFYPYYGAR